jgi:hypothetical protein
MPELQRVGRSGADITSELRWSRGWEPSRLEAIKHLVGNKCMISEESAHRYRCDTDAACQHDWWPRNTFKGGEVALKQTTSPPNNNAQHPASNQ